MSFQNISLPPASQIFFLARDEDIQASQIESALVEEDRTYLENCRSKLRVLEYQRSRWLIRQVIQQPFSALPQNGLISWPIGICASLSHKQGHVAFGYRETEENLERGFGLDIEATDRDIANIRPKILRPQEISRLEEASPKNKIDNISLCTIFSFKESVYKCMFPLYRQYFGFHDFEILSMKALDDHSGKINGKLLVDFPAKKLKGTMISGFYRYLPAHHIVLSVCTFDQQIFNK